MNELMRRTTPGLAVAGAALAAVWLFDPALHPEPEPMAAGAAGSSDPAPEDGSAAGGTDAPGAAEGASPGNTSSGATSPGDTSPDGSGTADQAPEGSGCSTPAALTGDPVMTRWGPVQVRMEVAADGTVCDVRAVAYPDDDRRSAQINASAIPYLDSQAAELGVEFDAFSGATYTSEAYRQSLQSILDQR